MVVNSQRADKPRSASTSTVQSAGTLPCKAPKRASQWGRQAPARVASTTRQATGMAQPRTTTLIERIVKRCPSVEASMARARWRQVGSVQATTQQSRGAKHRTTSRLRRLRPRLAPLLSLASRYQSRSCSRRVISEQPNTEAKVTATVVRPQAWARTMPKLHRTRTVNWGWLRWGKYVDTVCCHCNNPDGRAIGSSWCAMTGWATVILAEGWPAFQNA